MQVKLVFSDWQKDGESVYHRSGIEQNLSSLNSGNLYSGSTFDAELSLDEDDRLTILYAQKLGVVPVFYVTEE